MVIEDASRAELAPEYPDATAGIVATARQPGDRAA
jgi:hypothetical protein